MRSGGGCLRWDLFFFCMVFFFSIQAAPSCGQELSPQSDKILNFLQWEGNFLSWHREGLACWIEDSKGNLRCEIMLGGLEKSSTNLKRIMDWNASHGWTVITVETGGGTFSRWNEEWQKLPPAMDSWLRALVSQCGHGHELPTQVRDISSGGRPLALPLFESNSNLPRVKRIQLPLLSPAVRMTPSSTNGLRDRMTDRGHGRGGKETVLNVVGTALGSDEMRITSSHQPGVLSLTALQLIPAEFTAEEVFLPWWPLSEAVRLEQ